MAAFLTCFELSCPFRHRRLKSVLAKSWPLLSTSRSLQVEQRTKTPVESTLLCRGGSVSAMDASRSSPFRPSMGPLGAGRLRSASPSRRALAIDMRRIASLLRDPAGALHGPHHEGMNNSICSSPNSAWEPGDRGAAPMTTQATQARTASLSRTIIENQFTALAERINAGVTTLQRQCELDRRRLTQVEKKLDAKTAEADKHDGRERWAEVQGSVSGLLEETQAWG